MGDEPPPYIPSPNRENNNNPSAPPAYFQSLSGDQSKGVDWRLNSATNPSGSHSGYTDGYRPAPSGPSAPTFSEVRTDSSSKGIDWSLNRRPEPPARTVTRPNYTNHPASRHPVYPGIHGHGSQGHGSHGHPSEKLETVRGVYPAVLNTPVPQDLSNSNTFTRWKLEFSRHYPGAKMSRDTPSILKVEIPKNRAFPVVGHATCPDCFDHGPHQTQHVKKKDGILSTKKLPGQKCRRCFKLTYFIHSDEVAEERLPRDKPPPYTNRPSQIGFNRQGLEDYGHGWGSSEDGHGWNPGEGDGHGWGRT